MGGRQYSAWHPVDRTDWKSYIPSLMFFKRICDVWDEEYQAAVATRPKPCWARPIQAKRPKRSKSRWRQRLRKHLHNPRFCQLSGRLEPLKERHEQGQLHSVELLKRLLDLAKHQCRGTRSQKGAAQDVIRLQAASGCGVVREGVWLCAAVLLRRSVLKVIV